MLKISTIKEFSYTFYENKKNISVNAPIGNADKLLPFISESIPYYSGLTISNFYLRKVKNNNTLIIDINEVPEIESSTTLTAGDIKQIITGNYFSWYYEGTRSYTPDFADGYYYFEFTDNNSVIYYSEIFYIGTTLTSEYFKENIENFSFKYPENKENVNVNKILASNTYLIPFHTKQIIYDDTNYILNFELNKVESYADLIITDDNGSPKIETNTVLSTALVKLNILGTYSNWYFEGTTLFSTFASGYYYFYIKDANLNEFYSELFYVTSDTILPLTGNYILTEAGEILNTESGDRLTLE